MKWITRQRVRMDRVGSAWLIKTFIDPDAQFLFVPREKVMGVAQQEQATPFHVSESELGQAANRTGFEVLVEKYNITDPAVQRIAEIIHAAEKRGSVPEAAGLYAIIHGFFLMELDDHKALEFEIPIFDALYRYCQDRIGRQGETHATKQR